MTYITKLPGRKTASSSRIITLVLVGFVLLLLQPSTVQAQWSTSGNNISPTDLSKVVGIGTSSPTSTRLHVVHNTANEATIVAEAGSSMSPALEFKDAAATPNRWRVGSGLISTTDGMFFIYDKRQSAARMIIDTSGNVGIGTTNTGYAKLQVNKMIRIDDDSGSANGSDTVGVSPSLYLGTSTGGGMFQFNGSGGIDLWQFNSAWGRTVTFGKTGNVGIGTTSPTAKLHVYGSGNIQGIVQSTTGGAELDLISSATNSGSWGMGTGWGTAGLRSFYLYDNVASATRLMVDGSGNVGIGITPSASYKLDVNGGINSSGNINATGNITASGSISAKYQDVAEWVPSSHALPSGTVVTLDPTKSNHVEASSHAYDTRVAGVVSEQPGIALGESGAGKVLVATTGRVRVKVDASRGAIQVGDLLVTSDEPGVAMKSQPIDVGGVQIHRPGTLIGKALEPLTKGTSEILVLLSLQ